MKLIFNQGLYGSLCMWSLWSNNGDAPMTQSQEYFKTIVEGLTYMKINQNSTFRKYPYFTTMQLIEVITLFKTTGKLL